jgi:hypothetical protein
LLVALVGALILRSNPDLAERAPFFAPDPWATAVTHAQATLRESPDFESRLFAYQSLAAEVDRYIGLLDAARLPLGVIDELRKTAIPIVGNAWQTLVSILNLLAPGSGLALDVLDEALRQTVAFKGRLEQIRESGAVIAALRRFQVSPGRTTLVELRDACAAYGNVLSTADKDVQTHAAALAKTIAGVEGIEQGLLRAEDSVARIPLLPDALRTLRQAVSGLFDPLRNLHAALSALHDRFQTDLATMQAIQDIVAQVEHPR